MKRACLYPIVDQVISFEHNWNPLSLAEAYLAGGARVIQLRMHMAAGATFLKLCDQVVAAAEPFDAKVIVNDRADLARMSGAHGVHVGQSDLPVKTLTRLLPRGSIVGLSTHGVSQINKTINDQVSYIAVGPVFETKTKQSQEAVKGVELIKSAVWKQDKPVIAIGGITLQRVSEVMRAGATGVAVISDLLVGNEPERRVRDYLDCLEGVSK